MITVIAIMAILMAVVAPAASRMWAQRNEAASANLLRGLLESARMQAMRDGERGLFFFLDPESGGQRVVFLAAAPPRTHEVGVSEVEAVNRYRVLTGASHGLPQPYRAAPLTTALLPAVWTDAQLLRERFSDAPGADTPRYQRNFFVVLFNRQGELAVGRDVWILDADTDLVGPGAGRGDVTGLAVADVGQAWTPAGSTVISAEADPDLTDMVVLADGRAAGFVSVDGLVVYDESDLEDLVAAGVREVLQSRGQPFYLSRNTGDIIRGSQ